MKHWRAIRDGLLTGVGLMIVYTPRQLEAERTTNPQREHSSLARHFARVGNFIQAGITAQDQEIKANNEDQLRLPLSS